MLPSLIIGFDPGITGAYALYWPHEPNAIIAREFPTAAGEVDLATLSRDIAAQIEPGEPVLAIIELVHSMPRQGVASSFKFGAAYGGLRGLVAAMQIPTHLVSPSKWKRHYGLSADKEQARALALRKWPGTDLFSRKKDKDRAEAALIALYGWETLAHARAAA